jgi:anti-sigma factor RsiW
VKPEDTATSLHAYLDGELDAAKSRDLEAEMAADPALRASCERLRELSAAIREKADYYPAPARRTRMPKPSFGLAVAFALIAAIAFGLGGVFTTLLPRSSEDEALVASHVRAALGAHLIDVASSDQHTVKPWLSERLPYSPPVADLSLEGFELLGARLDYVGGQRVAVLVYKRRQHVVDVFISPGGTSGAISTRDGFNVQHFARDGMRYSIVSDLNRNELNDLARLLETH